MFRKRLEMIGLVVNSWYVDSIFETCPMCELFKETKIFRELPHLGRMASEKIGRRIDYLYKTRPCEWGAHKIKRYPDRKIREAKKKGIKLAGYNPSKADINHSISYRHSIPYPSLTIKTFYNDRRYNTFDIIRAVDPRSEKEPIRKDLIPTVLSYLEGSIDRIVFNEIKKSFEHDLADERKNAMNRAEFREHDRRKGLNITGPGKYDEFDRQDLLKLLKIAKDTKNMDDIIRITQTMTKKGFSVP